MKKTLLLLASTLTAGAMLADSFTDAVEAFYNYDFDAASKHLAAWRTTLKKSDATDIATADSLASKIEIGKRMLAHADRITVIDSIAVDADDFFRHYRLPRSAGRLLAPEDIPIPEAQDEASMAYSNEAGDFLMWAKPDSIGTLRIVEASRLTDGQWSEPIFTPEKLNGNGDADFPFLSSDGTMLYYAADGEDSLGCYDIYAATRDSATDYLDPMNLGMPFNSPFDDYLLVYDDENGVGWWATDRNQLDGKLTIYIFLNDDERPELTEDDDPIVFAKISDYKATWQKNPSGNNAEGQDYNIVLKHIASINTVELPEPEFRLPIPGGKFYLYFEDFYNSSAEKSMHQYLKLKEEQEEELARLDSLRHTYAQNRSKQTASEILRLEASTERRATTMTRTLSDVYRAEFNSSSR